MKTPTEQILETVRELREARAKATQGEWDELPASQEWKDNKVNNAAFVRLAANKMDQLCQALEICVDALEKHVYLKTDIETEDTSAKGDIEFVAGVMYEAIIKTAKILAKGKNEN